MQNPFSPVGPPSTFTQRSALPRQVVGASVIVPPTVISSGGGIEGEAMTVMVSLDKGIRSGIVSQQCESVVRFSELIKKYPLPVIANTALLKLAEVFQSSDNNFVRYWIVGVFDEVKAELPKVLNKNELIKRISSVLASNEPIARALTLRLLATMPAILSDRVDIHQKIQTSLLTCTEASEHEAAVLAVEQICSVSSQFATQIQPRLENLVRDLKTPVHAKLQLIGVMKHMHSADHKTVQHTFDTLKALLEEYPAQDFVIVILDTATQLAARSVLTAKQSFALLFQVLAQDVRKKIKITCLKNIADLSSKLSDIYTREFPSSVLHELLIDSPYRSVRVQVLRLLASLSRSLYNIRTWFSMNKSSFIPILEHFFFHTDDRFVNLSLEIMINAVRHDIGKTLDQDAMNRVGNEDIVSTAVARITDALCISLSKRLKRCEPESESLKCLCEYVVRFVKVAPQKSATEITETIVNHCLIFDDNLEKRTYGKRLALIGKCLYKYTLQCTSVIVRHANTILNFLIEFTRRENDGHTSETNEQETDHFSNIMTSFVGALLRSYQYNIETSSIPNERLLELLKLLQDRGNDWTLYLVSREALYYGFHDIAHLILSTICSHVNSEFNYHWLVHLQRWMSAEHDLRSTERDNGSVEYTIDSAITILRASLNALSLQTGSSSSKKNKRLSQEEMAGSHANSGFQIDFLQWRQAFVYHLHSLMALLSTNSRKERISTVHLSECGNNLRSLANRMKHIMYSHFNIDNISFVQLQLQRQQCLVMASAIEKLLLPSDITTNGPQEESEYNTSIPPLGLVCQRIMKCVGNTTSNSDVSWLINSVLRPLLRVPLQVPPLYFEVSRHTFVQLEIEINKKHISTSTAIGSSQQYGGFTIGATVGQGLVVHFSGYIQLGEKKKGRRRVDSVDILLDKKQIDDQQQQQQDGTEEEQRIPIKVVEDSFQVESVIHFRHEGLYQVTVRLELVDQTLTSWHTKINECINIHVEPIKLTSRLAAFT